MWIFQHRWVQRRQRIHPSELQRSMGVGQRTRRIAFPCRLRVREVVHHRPYANESTGGFHCLLDARKRCIGGLLNFLHLRFV